MYSFVGWKWIGNDDINTLRRSNSINVNREISRIFDNLNVSRHPNEYMCNFCHVKQNNDKVIQPCPFKYESKGNPMIKFIDTELCDIFSRGDCFIVMPIHTSLIFFCCDKNNPLISKSKSFGQMINVSNRLSFDIMRSGVFLNSNNRGFEKEKESTKQISKMTTIKDANEIGDIRSSEIVMLCGHLRLSLDVFQRIWDDTHKDERSWHSESAARWMWKLIELKFNDMEHPLTVDSLIKFGFIPDYRLNALVEWTKKYCHFSVGNLMMCWFNSRLISIGDSYGKDACGIFKHLDSLPLNSPVAANVVDRDLEKRDFHLFKYQISNTNARLHSRICEMKQEIYQTDEKTRVLYHGTTIHHAESIVYEGSRLMGEHKYKDFGLGFYLTSDFEAAVFYSKKSRESQICMGNVDGHGLNPCVLVFIIKEADLLPCDEVINHAKTPAEIGKLTRLNLIDFDEWKSVVSYHRKTPTLWHQIIRNEVMQKDSKKKFPIDVVFGCVSTANFDDEITQSEVEQYSFRTNRALGYVDDHLRFIIVADMESENNNLTTESTRDDDDDDDD